MTKQEMNSLWRLMGCYRKDDPRLRDKTLLLAWYLALAPYPLADVRQAVAEHFRTSNFWPDVCDLVKRCPPPPEEAREDSLPPSPLAQRWGELRRRRQAQGLPATISQAREQGMAPETWWKALEDAGLNL